MKKYKTTIIALIIICVVLAAYFISKEVGVFDAAPEATDVPVETGYVLEFPEEASIPGDIIKVSCSGDGETVVIKKIAAEWECLSNPEITVVTKNINTALRSCANYPGRVVYTGEIDDDAKKSFGLTDESDYITYELSDGSTYTVRFGDSNSTGSSVYAWREGTNKVYLLDKSYKTAMIFSPMDLITTTIFTFSDSGQIDKIQIYKNGTKEIEMVATFNVEGDSVRSWSLTAPLQRGGDSDKIETLISNVTAITVADFFEPDCQNLSDYGLSPASYRITMRDPSGTITLSIGKKTAEGDYYYATVDDSSDVYLIEADSVNFKDETVLTFMDRTVYLVFYTEISQVEMNLLGETHVLTYNTTDDEDNFAIDGQNVMIGESDFRTDFKRIGTAMYSLEITNLEDEPETRGELLCSLNYTLKDGSVILVECNKRDETTMYFYINGEYVGGYGSQYILTASSENYGIQGTLWALLDEIAAAKG